MPVYVAIGSGDWLATFESGIHATIAGVALGLLAPARAFLPEVDAERIADELSADAHVTPTEIRDKGPGGRPMRWQPGRASSPVAVLAAGHGPPPGPFDRAQGDWAAIDAAGPVEHYAVLRGPCYVGLTTLVGAVGWFDGVIALLEDGRALAERDVTDVLSVPGSPPYLSIRSSPGPPMPASSLPASTASRWAASPPSSAVRRADHDPYAERHRVARSEV